VAWQKYTYANCKASKPEISLTIPARHHGNACPFLLLGPGVLQQLGWSGGDEIQIFVGTDHDAGKVRIEKQRGGCCRLMTPRGKRRRMRVNLGALPSLADRPFRGDLAYVAERGSLILSLPESARSDALPAGTAEVARTTRRSEPL
jgi:hypothetical protein